jgi:hypothetical protein
MIGAGITLTETAATVQVGMGKMEGMKMDGKSSSASPQPR